MWRCVGCKPPRRTPPRRFGEISLGGMFHQWGYPEIRMVYDGKPIKKLIKLDDLGVPIGVPTFLDTSKWREDASPSMFKTSSKAHQLSGDIAELLHKKLQKAVAVGCGMLWDAVGPQ